MLLFVKPGGAHVIDRLRTASARFMTSHRLGPVALQVRAWSWLAAETDHQAAHLRCLEAIVALDPSLDWAQAALTRAWYRRRGEQSGAVPAYVP